MSRFELRELSGEGEVGRAWSELGGRFSPPLASRDGFAALVAKMARWGTTLAAVGDGGLLGCVTFYANDPARGGFVTLIAASAAAQGTGVGSALLEAAEGRCREAGMRSVSLEVRDGNACAEAFYSRHGYRAVGRGEGSTLMGKGLEGGGAGE